MFILMVLVLVVVSLLLVSLARVVLIEKNLFNLIYLIGSNIIFALGAWFFYFYFHENILTLIAIFFLGGYAILLVREIKKIRQKWDFFSFPYMGLILSVLLLDLFYVI